MSQREILTNGNAFKRTDGRWGGTVWYLDEKGERKRKSFSGTTKAEVNKKMKKYIVDANHAHTAPRARSFSTTVTEK